MKTLGSLKAGQSGTVAFVNAQGAVKTRLLDMGITTGAHIVLERTAPFGDPIVIRLRGYSLSLRREEAENIFLK